MSWRKLFKACVIGLALAFIVGVVPFFRMPGCSRFGPTGMKFVTKAMVKDLLVAISGFQTEYGGYPVPPAAAPKGDFDGPVEGDMLAALIGTTGSLNPKGIPFLECRIAMRGKHGLDLTVPSHPRLFDPWGREFYAVVDTDRSVTVAVPHRTGALGPLPMSVAVWSCGPDGIAGNADDITSW